MATKMGVVHWNQILGPCLNIQVKEYGYYTTGSDQPGLNKSVRFRLQLNCITGFPGSPASRWQTVGLLRCRDSVSPYLLIKLSTYKRLVLFLCRTLTKHVQEVICENEKTLELVIVTFNDLKR